MFLLTVTASGETIYKATDTTAYQGIFMNGDIFLNMPLYTASPDERVGIVYKVSDVCQGDNNYVQYEIDETIGEIYKLSDSVYCIKGDNIEAGLRYNDGNIEIYSLTGSSDIPEGTYVQVSNSGANTDPKTIWLNIPQSQIDININGSKISFEQAPFIDNGTTMVPMRAIFEALGADVDWNNAAKTVTAVKGEIRISLTIDDNTAYINEKSVSLDSKPVIKSGTTMVPVRFVSEALGATVDWNASDKSITITTNENSQND
jgi:hypothetical protein